MYTAHASHIPPGDPVPAWRQRKLPAWLPVVATVLLLPAPARAQEVRAIDLSIIEDLLADTIQEAIQFEVREINTENLSAREAELQRGDTVQIRYVFRSGGSTQARGMFLEDYGAIFTVQLPNLTYTHSAMFSISAGGSVTMGRPGSLETFIAGALGEEMQLRNQMSRMRAENEVMIQRLERAFQTSGAPSQSLRTALSGLESAYNEYAARAERIAGDSERARAAAEGPGNQPARYSDRLTGLRILSSPSREDMARAETLATLQKNQIEGTIIEAVVSTLAQYGRVIHGLDNDDRLAVVLLPSSYLSQLGSWSRATRRDEEFVISVRFRDVMELDKGDIDEQEFGGRIRVESRLGQPHTNR